MTTGVTRNSDQRFSVSHAFTRTCFKDLSILFDVNTFSFFFAAFTSARGERCRGAERYKATKIILLVFTNLLSTTLELTPRRSTSSTAALRPRQRAGRGRAEGEAEHMEASPGPRPPNFI